MYKEEHLFHYNWCCPSRNDLMVRIQGKAQSVMFLLQQEFSIETLEWVKVLNTVECEEEINGMFRSHSQPFVARAADTCKVSVMPYQQDTLHGG